MDGLSHIFLHVGLCSAVARLAPDAPIAMHVQMRYVHGAPPYDKTLQLVRGEADELVVEFDVPWNVYHVDVSVPKYHCTSSSFAAVLAEQNRSIAVKLSEQPSAAPPLVLFDGTAPTSFVYMHPAYVLLPNGTACQATIPTPLDSHIDIDYEQGAYYLALQADPALLTSAPPVFAVQFLTPRGLAHYVRIPVKLPPYTGGWPATIQFNITEDMIDELATEKTGVLLCPKIWGTSGG
jgi:hypothetical protein